MSKSDASLAGRARLDVSAMAPGFEVPRVRRSATLG